MTSTGHLALLMRYTAWANRRLFEASPRCRPARRRPGDSETPPGRWIPAFPGMTAMSE